jgi:hypothetical protein
MNPARILAKTRPASTGYAGWIARSSLAVAGLSLPMSGAEMGKVRIREKVMNLEGGCYCGALRYSAEGAAMMKGQCHCRECQYITGGSPNMFIAMPVGGFSYTKGSPKLYARSDLERPVTREFCAECGTHVVTRPQGFPAIIVKVGTLDDPTLFGGPDVAIFMMDKQPFHQVPDGVQTFERLPIRTG